MLETRKVHNQKNGMIVSKQETIYSPDVKKDSSAIKQEAKDKMVTEHNTVQYDTDTTSLVYMNAVTNTANFKFIKAMLTIYPDLQLVYDAIYKSTIDWKGADNLSHTVQIESLAEAIETTMTALATDVIKV